MIIQTASETMIWTWINTKKIGSDGSIVVKRSGKIIYQTKKSFPWRSLTSSGRIFVLVRRKGLRI